MVPWYDGQYHGRLARFDLSNFHTSGVEYIDLSAIDTELKGFIGGFAVGDYGYLSTRLHSNRCPGAAARDHVDAAARRCAVPYRFASGSSGRSGKVVRFAINNFNSGGIDVLDNEVSSRLSSCAATPALAGRPLHPTCGAAPGARGRPPPAPAPAQEHGRLLGQGAQAVRGCGDRGARRPSARKPAARRSRVGRSHAARARRSLRT